MTLQEHAQNVFGRFFRLPYLSQTIWGTREDYYNLAYNELRADLQEHKEKIHGLEWDLKQEKERVGYMFKALVRVAESLGLGATGKGTMLSEIADKAVRVIHEQKVAIDALERLRVQCWSLKSDPDSIVDQALAELTRLREGEAKQPEPPKKAVYEWAPWGHDPCGWTLLRDGVAAGTVEETLPNRRLFYWQAFPERMPKLVESQISPSFPLAKAAVEAVVRAHYGDEA